MKGLDEILTMFRGGSRWEAPPLDDHHNPALARCTIAEMSALIRQTLSFSTTLWHALTGDVEDASGEHNHKTPFCTLKSVLF